MTIAVVVLAVFVFFLAALGAVVLVKVFAAALGMRRQVGNLPAALRARQAQLNAAQSQIVKAQRELRSRGVAIRK